MRRSEMKAERMNKCQNGDKMKKYIVYPGFVTSRNDGDRHYVSASQLIHLHKVQNSECIIVRGRRDYYKLHGINRELINLIPRSDGNYKSYNKRIQTDADKPHRGTVCLLRRED
uniref:Uncharacterized protein n=1 Tax=viral metagenome TaxID=1070528 RepID=A0A6M3LH95_9ZZZZ